MKSFLRFSTLIIAAALVLSACAPKPAVARPPLKIEWSLWPGDYPIVLAKELGLYEKYGVQVEPVFYDLSSDAMSDIAAGKIDGGLFVMGDALVSSQNDGLRAVLVTDISNGADQVVATSDIQSVADLKGKRVGAELGSFSELFVREMLKSASLSASDVKLVNVVAEQLPDAIPSQVDAGHTWDPYTNQAIQNGAHIIFTSAQTPGLVPDILGVRTQIVQERPDDVRALIQAWLAAVQYWQDNPEISKTIIAKYAKMKPEEISSDGIKIYSLSDNVTALQRTSNTTSIYYTAQLYLDFLINAGDITNPIDINRVIDPSFVNDLSKTKP